nr:Chain C, peptide [synthetic construct]4H25_F Chain F, peptide [synthetic construct]
QHIRCNIPKRIGPSKVATLVPR